MRGKIRASLFLVAFILDPTAGLAFLADENSPNAHPGVVASAAALFRDGVAMLNQCDVLKD